ncbi:MAG: Flp pilus assembly complex ATPase component TadA [Aerococcus sp.]|nr:Flp pilus assembly complex ATPase component TadA [Aerococcus sp.]
MKEWTDQLIKGAYDARADDIHVIPEGDNYSVYYRIGGKLQWQSSHPIDDSERWLRYIKFTANMDVGERRLPQDGSMMYQSGDIQIELRLSTIANYLMQESLVIRLLYSEMTFAQPFHNFSQDVVARLWDATHRKSGLIIFSGPVSSGKTTTIYQLLHALYAEQPRNIITMEDPVEIKYAKFLQVAINAKAGITYERVIRASLRHHPDILMIGEIRDEETARMVIRAALTGHLVLATVHARDCVGVIGRLQELGISKEQLIQTLLLVTSQRLVPKRESEEMLPIVELMNSSEVTRYLFTQKVPESVKRLNQQLEEGYTRDVITKAVYQSYRLEEVEEL